jgi:chemotaxis protein MotB
MLKRFVHLIAVALVALSLNGCLVAESTYLKKVEEADHLTSESVDLKQKLEKLAVENSTIKGERDNQLREKKELEQLLRTKSDTLSQNVSELRQKIATLEAENMELRKVREDKAREVSTIYEKLLQDMKNEIAFGQVTISELRGKLSVTMEAAILFDSGRVDIKPDGLAILLKMVETLKGVKERTIRIEGHTDNMAITGALARTFPTTWELSAARAISVTRYLQRQGVDPSLLSAAAFGGYRPVADNDTREGRARNRRIEITLVAKD